uniref:MYND-type domain-containing protein n=1 Tax=Plectus sambesii TaxID=2011161 RepID=A0A914WTF8_9BILA
MMSRSATVRAADSLATESADVRANSVSPAIPINPLAVTARGDSRNDRAAELDECDDDDDTLITPLATSLTETEEDDETTPHRSSTSPSSPRALSETSNPALLSLARVARALPRISATGDVDDDDDHYVTAGDNGHSSIDSADTGDRLVTPPSTVDDAARATIVAPAQLPDSALPSSITDVSAADNSAGFKSNPTPLSPSLASPQPTDASRDSNGSSDALAQEERFSRAYENFFVDRRRSREMDIDLERAMRRFARYGQVYRDAPHSELEEFTKDKEESPRSSADTSLSNVLLFPTRNGKDAAGRGRHQSSPDITTLSASRLPAGNRDDEMRSSISRGPTRASPDNKVRFADSTADSDESGSAVGFAPPPISKVAEERSERREDRHTVENTPDGRREVTKSEKREILYSSQTLTKTFDVPKRTSVFENPFSDEKFSHPDGHDKKKSASTTVYSPVARNYGGSDWRSSADSTAKKSSEPARFIPVEREYSPQPPAARPPPPPLSTMSQQRSEPGRGRLDPPFGTSQSTFRREEHLATTLTTLTTSSEKLVGTTNKRPTELFGGAQRPPMRQEVTVGYIPEARRIDPPKQVERVYVRDDDDDLESPNSKRFANRKAYFGSSEHLHQLLDGSFKKKPQYSKETEEQMMREAQERRRMEEEERRRTETERRRVEEERRRIEEERRGEEEERRRVETEKRRVEEERRLIEAERRRLEEQRRKCEEERISLEAQSRRLEIDRRNAEAERRRVSEEQLKQEEQRRKLADERKRMGMLLTSREMLQQLTKDPYYSSQSRSKEALSTNNNNQVTTSYVNKVEREEVRRYEVDPAPLNEHNLRSWSNRPENIADQSNNMYRWRNSMNLTDAQEAANAASNNYAPSTQPSQSSTAHDLPSPAPPRERIYTQRKLPDDDENAFHRGSTKRTSKYKAKVDKARRDFLSQQEPDQGNSAAPRASDDVGNKFRKSTEDMRRPKPEYRGPLLQKFHSGEFNSKVDLSDLPPMSYGKVAPSPYDQEYKRLVAKAEQNWASYKKRMSQPNLYSRNRAWSTSYLETDVDTGKGGQVASGPREVEETDLDDVHGRSYVPTDYERTSRIRTKAPAGPIQVESHTRSKSADYLMDRRAREETEPPENQLQKILGDASREPSEHELRFRKSLDKLHVPDWYLNSDYCGQKPDLDASRSTAISYQNYSTAETPVRQYYDLVRPTSSQSHYQQYENRQPPYEHRLPPYQPANNFSSTTQQQTSTVRSSEQTSYTSPWVTGGRFSGPNQQGGTSRRAEEPQTRTQPSATRSRAKSPTPLTKDFTGMFEKYKNEIEELRRSRTSLHQLSHDANEPTYGAGNVPVATVKPRQLGAPERSYSSMSPGATSPSGVHFRPVTEKSQQSNFAREEFGSHEGIFTSTPRSSGHLTRKQFPESNKQYEVPVQRAPSAQSSTNTAAQQEFQKSQQIQQQSQFHQRSLLDQLKQQMESNTKPSPYQLQSFQSSPNKPGGAKTTTTTTTVQHLYQERKQETTIESSVRQLPGYTVSTLPTAWNEPKNRNSVVIEVADTFVGPKRVVDGTGKVSQRYGGRVTLEEVLDSMLALPSQRTTHLATLDESNEMDTSLPQIERPTTPVTFDGPSIYSRNQTLMEHVVKNQPDNAEELLKNEALVVRCGYCNRTNDLEAARQRFVSCKHCYSYYCSRICRRTAWELHKDRCSFARVNTMCKDVIMKVREDPEAQWQMSRVARQGYATRGRGSVNFRFRSPFMAEKYVKGGWSALSAEPGNYLFYYTIPTLIEERKEPSLIALCRKYDPRGKFILSVSIIADIEQCPSTPPPETVDQSWAARPEQTQQSTMSSYVSKQQTDLNGNSVGQHYSPASHHRQNSLPQRYHRAQQSQPDAKTVLKSVLRSLENIAPGPTESMHRSSSAQQYRPITPQAIRSDV